MRLLYTGRPRCGICQRYRISGASLCRGKTVRRHDKDRYRRTPGPHRPQMHKRDAAGNRFFWGGNYRLASQVRSFCSEEMTVVPLPTARIRTVYLCEALKSVIVKVGALALTV